jgi:Fe-S-cluster-containing dehydrogenase component
MVIDTKRCLGCGACVAACKTEHDVPAGLHRVWVREEVRGAYPDLAMELRSERCNQCVAAACVSACPTGASQRAGDSNVVVVEAAKCTGCKACIASCPYGARFVMPDGHVDKCTFCRERLERREPPACAAVCPAKAIVFGNLNNPLSEAARLLRNRPFKTLLPEAGTRPQIYYLT